jgi:tetratricopeptide (TPR) repeat protein
MRQGKVFCVLLTTLILVFGAYLNSSQQKTGLSQQFLSANKSFEQGKDDFFRGNLKKAEKELKLCLEKYPEHADAFFYLSQIYYRKGKLQEALGCIDSAEKNLDAMVSMVKTSNQQQIMKYRQQKEELEKYLLEANILSAGAACDGQRYRPSLESELIEIQGKIEKLENELNQIGPKTNLIRADYTYFCGNIFFKMNKLGEAQKKYLEAIQLNPKHKNAYNNLVNLYNIAGQYERAHFFLSQAETRGVEINQGLKNAVLKALKKK